MLVPFLEWVPAQTPQGKRMLAGRAKKSPRISEGSSDDWYARTEAYETRDRFLPFHHHAQANAVAEATVARSALQAVVVKRRLS
ncbi:hypothetical protein [Paraeggerthella sp.]|uniref:hypothetical protein n=1 Tax=Paraeggerthella sp. TaxID=2897350 RepID=UPI002A8832D1|nr:hypothetical protein [Paraeggerthella sp.]